MKAFTLRHLALVAAVASWCLLLPGVSAAQSNKPAISYESLMDLRFYENDGGFLIENLEVVFPPSGKPSATFVIMRPGGEVVASEPLQYSPLERLPAFGRFFPAPGKPSQKK